MRLWTALFLVSLCLAEPVRWQGKFDRALALSRQSGKPMAVLVIERGCEACKKVIADINADETLSRCINTRTVPVVVIKEYEDYPVELLYTLVYPTLFLLTPDERFLADPLKGPVDSARLRRLLEEKLPDKGALGGGEREGADRAVVVGEGQGASL
ncbi:MAG: hypothetical protein GXO33_07200 [Epsilonproteobacteria bacterium]|nr:hypothetical protein [Campylobacterota bacterium]